MYAVGTSILYGQMGVCQIESIGESPFREEAGRSYYKLRARFSSSGELIYIPVDADRSLRPLIDSGAAADCLDLLASLTPQVYRTRRPADLTVHYQEMLASCDPRDSLLLLKEINCKKRDLAAHGKKLSQVDVRYLKLAERLVCEELAAALDTTPDLMKGRVYAAMESEQPK